MSSDTLTNREVASLLALMAEAREVTNTELDARYRFTIVGGSRRKLNDLKLVETRKKGRTFSHELTDDGWARCAEELGSPLPAGRASAATLGALYAVLGGIHHYAERNGLVPADLFSQPSDPAPANSAPAKATPAKATPAKATPAKATPAKAAVPPPTPEADAPSDLEANIRGAYRTLAQRPGDWVGLAKLRPLLGDAARSAVDGALTRMVHEPGVTIVPEENQKTLTRSDRSAAVTIGGQANHYLAIADA
jgi:hypothetical protein